MARRRDEANEQLAVLKAAAEDGNHEALIQLVEEYLSSSCSIVAAEAAKLIPEQKLAVSKETLLTAYERFLIDPTETDKGCRAKLPIVEALSSLDYDDPDFYTAGTKYVQMEPMWGKSEDSAGNLRGACAFGLIRSRSASPAATMRTLVDLLNDPSPLTRTHAANAIGLMGSQATVPLLRFKIHVGDSHSEVLGECFRGLIEHDSSSGISFVSESLLAEPEIAIEAAMALGESRKETAIESLLDAMKHCSSEVLEAFYITAGLSRVPAVLDFMIEHIRSNSPNACLAVRSLAPNRFYPDITTQVQAAVQQAGDQSVDAAFEEHFSKG